MAPSDPSILPPSGPGLGVRGAPGGLWGALDLSRCNHKSLSFSLAWRNARSRLINNTFENVKFFKCFKHVFDMPHASANFNTPPH